MQDVTDDKREYAGHEDLRGVSTSPCQNEDGRGAMGVTRRQQNEDRRGAIGLSRRQQNEDRRSAMGLTRRQ